MKQILLVEDNDDYAETVVSLLELDGYEAHVVPSLGAAREALAQTAPWAVLVDLHLDDGLGTALVADLERSWPSSYRVLLSGDPDPGASGFHAVVNKLASFDELADALQSLGASS